MKAAVYTAYGPPEVIRIEEIAPPVLGEEDMDRLLVQVHSASVNPYDIFFRQGYYPIRLSEGFLRPKDHRLGGDMAGTVLAVGSEVSRFQPGDRVFGVAHGAYAEVARSREKFLAPMPAGATFHQAAALPTVGLTALEALRDIARVQPGQKVLIYGASGGIGHCAVQLACYFGAEVTAVTSTANQGWVQALGAHHMIDYTREDFTRNGVTYDLVYDTVGKRTFFNVRRSLAEGGLYITEHILYPKYHILQMILGRLTGDRRMRVHLTHTNAEGLEFLRERFEDGSLKPVVEKVYPLEQLAEAHGHGEAGHTKGKIVVEIRGE